MNNQSETKQVKTLTIVSVTGNQDYAQGSAYSIERSYEELLKKLPKDSLKCLLVSPKKPEHLANYIEHIPCQPFSYLEYNIFMLYSLDDLIETDFALIVQNDGFVVNGNNWKDEFFDYDFIGPPLYSMYEYITETKIREHILQACDSFYENMPENFFEGQNGGFSLRSKKLLGLPRKLNIRPLFSIPLKRSNSALFELTYGTGNHHEDTTLTITARKILMDNGIRYAPPIISAYFGCESGDVHKKRNIPLSQVLGCHMFGIMVLTSTTNLCIRKKTNITEHNILKNNQCRWLLSSGMNITIPKYL